jgi:PD-(D/E)XK endonuclease
MARAGSGNEGEAMILAALIRRGFEVLVPFGEGQPYDLVVHLGDNKFLRVQCKTAWLRQGCVVFNSHSTDHGRGALPYHGLADIFGVYFPPDGSVYLVPVDAVARFEGRLRRAPTRNNQRKRIREAVDFEIDRWTVDSLREVIGGEVGRDEPMLSVA